MAISFNSLGGYGRLGNQMFQYAALRGIAKEAGKEFCIPENGHRLFEVFEMKNATLRKENKIVMQNLTHKGFNFDKELFDTCPDYTDLYGYFQTEKYFDNIHESIREDFQFKAPDSSFINMLRTIAKGRPIVTIHVRRGDYIGLPDHHPLVGIEYYTAAKNIFDQAVFVLFSDDIEWCKEQEIFKDCILADVPDTTAMYTMSLSDHNIIANSSFSWWGAWLNNSHHKVVIAPKRWFGSAYIDYDLSDLYPPRWIIL